MAQANIDNITTATASRRSFLAKTAGFAAAGAAVALPALAAADPVLELIDAHKKAVALVDSIVVEQTRLIDLGLPDLPHLMNPASSEEFDLFIELIEAVPTTLAGIAALLTHLDWGRKEGPLEV